MSTTQHVIEAPACCAETRASGTLSARGLFARLRDYLRTESEHMKAREKLCRLSNHLRRDIGLAPCHRRDAFSVPELYEWEESRIR